VIPLAIFLGGGLGALTRYGVGLLLPSSPLPLGTLAVNLLGCLFLGFLSQIFLQRPDLPPELRLGLTTGLLGGLTTFSTFGYESLTLFNGEQPLLMLLNISANLLLGLLAAALGLWLAT